MFSSPFFKSCLELGFLRTRKKLGMIWAREASCMAVDRLLLHVGLCLTNHILFKGRLLVVQNCFEYKSDLELLILPSLPEFWDCRFTLPDHVYVL